MCSQQEGRHGLPVLRTPTSITHGTLVNSEIIKKKLENLRNVALNGP